MWVYYNVSMVLSTSGQVEARAAMLKQIDRTLELTDPASLEHCKQARGGPVSSHSTPQCSHST